MLPVKSLRKYSNQSIIADSDQSNHLIILYALK